MFILEIRQTNMTFAQQGNVINIQYHYIYLTSFVMKCLHYKEFLKEKMVPLNKFFSEKEVKKIIYERIKKI